MSQVSIIIPSRNEQYLAKMVDDIYAKATGDFEVIVVLDGPTDFPLPPKRPNLKFIAVPQPEGLRAAVNSAAAAAAGKFLLKADAHCLFAPGFDEILQADCDADWVVIARRFTLDPNLWQPEPHMPVDYFYLSCPWTHPRRFVMQNCPWMGRTKSRDKIPIDDAMTFQGSLWFMTADHFHNRLKGLSEEGYGDFVDEPIEIGMKTWLGGGRVIVNKKTWYAHLHKRYVGRGYDQSLRELTRGQIYSARYWTGNKWPDRVHDFDWLIDKFWPLPTIDTLNYGEKYYWPANWRDYYDTSL